MKLGKSDKLSFMEVQKLYTFRFWDTQQFSSDFGLIKSEIVQPEIEAKQNYLSCILFDLLWMWPSRKKLWFRSNIAVLVEEFQMT